MKLRDVVIIIQKDESAVNIYYDRLARLVWSRVKRFHLANNIISNEDLFQEGMIGLLKGIKSVDATKSVYQYLCVTIDNAIRICAYQNTPMKMGRQKAYEFFNNKLSEEDMFKIAITVDVCNLEGIDEWEEFVGDYSDIEEQIIFKDIFNRIPEAYKKTILMHLMGFEHKEIGNIEGICRQGVGQRITRTFNRLRKEVSA